MMLRYYSLLALIIIINSHVFSENILVNKTTKDTIYVDFNEYEPTQHEIFNLYYSRIELNENTVYEKLLGSAYYTGNQDDEGAELKFIFRSNSSIPEDYFIIPTGQIFDNVNLIVENYRDTAENKNKEKTKSDESWLSFDTSLSGGKSLAFFEEETHTKYSMNLGIIYKDAFRIRISPIIFEKDNLLINISLDMSLLLDFNDTCAFIYLGFFPYQKVENNAKYQISFGTGYHLNLFDSHFFLELSGETNIVSNEDMINDVNSYDSGFDFDVHFNIFASVGYHY